MSAAMQMEPPAMVAPRHGAIGDSKPKRTAPHVATKEAKPPRRKATLGTEPRFTSPSATHSATSESEIVTELVQLQRMRKHCIVAQSRCDRSIEQLIASMSGFRLDADESVRKASFARAASYRKRVEEEGGGQSADDTQTRAAPSFLDCMIIASAQARRPWDDQRARCEKDMERLAKLLPVYPFVASVRGLGAKGFAIIVAEAGLPIGEYRTVSGLWKRLGLAVIGGECQRRKRDKDAAAAHGYSPARRARSGPCALTACSVRNGAALTRTLGCQRARSVHTARYMPGAAPIPLSALSPLRDWLRRTRRSGRRGDATMTPGA